VAEVRALNAEDWRMIRDVRLRSLADAPDAFTSSVERESTYDDQKWRNVATRDRWFVADEGGPVGVAIGVNGWSGDETALASGRRPATSVRTILAWLLAPSSGFTDELGCDHYGRVVVTGVAVEVTTAGD
jgi:hypothetical protein